MPDVRDILAKGGDINPGLPDVAELVRRGQAARRRRAVALTGAVAGATAVVALVVAVLVRLAVPSATDLVPAPAPAAPKPLPLTAGPLEVGTYDASPAGVAARLDVPGSGWTLATVGEGWISLRHGRSTVALQHWDEVVDPAADPAGPADTGPLPEDLVGWLTSHPRLEVTGLDRVRGGTSWTAVGLSVDEPLSATPSECNTLPCVLLAVTGDEPTELLARDHARVLVPDELASPAAPPLIVVVTAPGGRPTPVPAVDVLLDSISPTPTER